MRMGINYRIKERFFFFLFAFIVISCSNNFSRAISQKNNSRMDFGYDYYNTFKYYTKTKFSSHNWNHTIVDGTSILFKHTYYQDSLFYTLFYELPKPEKNFFFFKDLANIKIYISNLNSQSFCKGNLIEGIIEGRKDSSGWSINLDVLITNEEMGMKTNRLIKEAIRYISVEMDSIQSRGNLELIKLEEGGSTSHNRFEFINHSSSMYDVFYTRFKTGALVLINGKTIPIYFDDNFNGWGIVGQFGIQESIEKAILSYIDGNPSLI